MSEPTQDTLRRLALIRGLYLRALETSLQPEPIGALSVLGFHDSVELFLQLAWEHVNPAGKPPVTLDGYWDPIDAALPDGSSLSGRMAMRQLNRARVGLKHGGILPAHSTIEGHRAATTSFLESNTALVFDGVTFDNLDLVQLVTFQRTRELLERSISLAERDEIGDALGHAALAFLHLRRDARVRLGWKGFAGWSNISAPPVGDADLWNALSDLASEVDGEIRRLEEAMEIVALGLDLRRWQRFLLWTPWIVTRAGEEPAYRVDEKVSRLKLGRAEVDYCRRFVIDSALRLQQLEP